MYIYYVFYIYNLFVNKHIFYYLFFLMNTAIYMVVIVEKSQLYNWPQTYTDPAADVYF